MTRELYLHIGVTKTGSTAIQNTLAQRRRDLEQYGVYVQNRPAETSHSLMAASVVNQLSVAPGRSHPMWGGVAPQTQLERFRRGFAREMDALPDWANICVISSEHLSSWLQHEDVARLAAWLRSWFDRITIVAYLRRQDQHVSSFYNEKLKSGIIPQADLLKSPDQVKKLDYEALLARYASAFGQSAIKPRIFARESLLNGNVVEDFFSAIGVDLGAFDQPTSNPSIDLTGQYLLQRAIGRLGQKNQSGRLNTLPEWRLITQAVESQCQGNGWRLSAPDARAFMGLFEASNEAVRLLYFPDRAKLFSSVYTDAPADVPTAPDTNLDACIEVMFRLAQAQCESESQSAMAQYKLFARLGDQAGMRDSIRLALRYAPGSIVARLRMAEMAMADGRPAESLDHLDAVLRLDPQNKEARLKKLQWQSREEGQTTPKESQPANETATL